MVESTAPGDETRQLQALHSIKVLDAQPDGRFERVTRLAKRLFNVPIALVCLNDQRPVALAAMLDVLETACETSSEKVFVVPDTRQDVRFRKQKAVVGDRAIRFCVGCPVYGPDGGRIAMLCLADFVPRTIAAEDRELLIELGSMLTEEFFSLSMATSDVLTKLANRRGFELIADHIVPMAKRLNLPLALVHIDLDRFKNINDTRGHEAGDRVLVTFARHLLKNFFESDVVARLGGDEFCVLMSATKLEVRQALRRLEIRLEQQGREPIRFSAGIAVLDPERHVTVADFLREADQRMYETKRRKRTNAQR